MKQVVQNLRSGVLELMEVGCPQVAAGSLLIESHATLISAGTERFLVEFGKASLVSKARQNPDRVKQVLTKIKSDGLLPTLEAVFNKLDEPLPLGYCNAGQVVEVGAGVTDYKVGDRVASNGNHAEFVCVPTNLCAKIPDNVSDEEAAFAVLSTIGLQGVRLVQPELGETVVVFGLGLVGMLAAQMLVASGAHVIGVDLDDARLELAKTFGITPVNPRTGADPVAVALAATGGNGVDAVLIAASAKQDTIMHQAAEMSRKRGRVVLVGVVDLNLDRADFYEKELTFQVSCSYGPGRYDPSYEEKGIDYPLPFVRWTEQRNLAAVLQMMGTGRLDVRSLTSSQIPFDDAVKAYEMLADKSQMGIVLTFEANKATQERHVLNRTQATASGGAVARQAGGVSLAMIGAGAFSKAVLLPAIAKTNAQLHTIVSAGGVSAAHAARKFGFKASATDFQAVLSDDEINTVVITTRHNLHATMVVDALNAGKHVFVEKPLALNYEELQQVREAYERTSDQHLMVGFNRRFAPQVQQMKELLQGRTGPLCMSMMVNAGSIPPEHWVHNPEVGGGRIIGEGCHWIDLLLFLTSSGSSSNVNIVSATADHVTDAARIATRDDHGSLSLVFGDGSIGTIHYFANGHRAFPKERLTVCCDGKVLELDNFRQLNGFGWPSFRRNKLMRQDKGHGAECQAFVDRVASGGEPLIPFEQLWDVTHASFQCSQLLPKPEGKPEDALEEACRSL